MRRRQGTIAACERSLKRLGTDRLDLYLLHWRGSVPLAETLEAFATLRRAGKIRHWGVSNFGIADMVELWSLPGGSDAAANQVLYNLTRRGIEWDLLPWCREHRMPVMAYSPIEQGRLLRKRGAEPARRGAAVSPQRSWRSPGCSPGSRSSSSPRPASIEHVRENRAALDLVLTPEELAELDRTFPPPDRAKPLEML